MSTNYPTSLDAYTDPTSSDHLNNPSHAQQHQNHNDAIEAIEAKLGIGASTPTANKVLRATGTGITSYGQIDITSDVASFTSANLKSLISDETGTGVAVFATNPEFVGADMNGTKLILDADADTSITADTNNQIDVEINGADDFRFTANDFKALSGSTISSDIISETTAASGVTIDGLLIKDSKLATNDSVVTSNITNGAVTAAKLATTPSRFVSVYPSVQVVSADPANTNWTSVDITANTSATATAALLKVRVTSSDTTRTAYIRKTGASDAADNTTAVCTTAVANVQSWGRIAAALDSSQSFDWSVDNANVTNITILVEGYWETIA